MGERKLSHSTVVSYVALIVALSTGGAYAVDKLTSHEIANNSIKSIDLKKRQAVAGSDVRRDSLAGAEIREGSLDGSKIASIVGVNDAGDCDPGAAPTDCVQASVDLARSARMLIVATGAINSVSSSRASARCDVRIDDGFRSAVATPGDESGGTDAFGTDGFARTLVTPEPVGAGIHQISLTCSELIPDVRIATPTIAAIAISTGKP